MEQLEQPVHILRNCPSEFYSVQRKIGNLQEQGMNQVVMVTRPCLKYHHFAQTMD
jgi:hypothetical protein